MSQTNPLSHFLFLIVAESLGNMIENALERGIYFPLYWWEKNKVEVSHLKFTDDCLLIGEASKKKLAIKSIKLVELASGPKVNYITSFAS